MTYLQINTPRDFIQVGFKDEMTVEDLIPVIVESASLTEGDVFELALENEILDGNTTIGELNLMDGTILDLIATGTAV
ncbi:MAG: hypothetical protein F4Z28_15435 [Gammaproteobacteria bacterium]|nr:hypothetical protein [Gammaproteobacteria bacterium]